MKLSTVVILTSLSIAGTAHAGGLADPIIPVAPPPAPAPIPLDFYAGLQAGIVSGDVAFNFAGANFEDVDMEGPIYGIHAGVRRDFGSLTFGVEVDYNTTNDDLEDSGTPVVIEMDRLARLKLHAGTTVGSTFIYGTAGIAAADITIENAGPSLDLSDTAPVYGLGADMMVTNSISVGGEFLVHDFEDMDGSGVDVGFNTAMLRVSFHF